MWIEWLLSLPIIGFFWQCFQCCENEKDDGGEENESECRGCPTDTAPPHLVVTIPPLFNVWPPDLPNLQCNDCPNFGGDYIVPAIGDQLDPESDCQYEVNFPSPEAGECNVTRIFVGLSEAGAGQTRVIAGISTQKRSVDGLTLTTDSWIPGGVEVFPEVDCDALNILGYDMIVDGFAAVCYGADAEVAPPGAENEMEIDIKAP